MLQDGIMTCTLPQPNDPTQVGCGMEHHSGVCHTWRQVGIDTLEMLLAKFPCEAPQPPDGRVRGCDRVHVKDVICDPWKCYGFTTVSEVQKRISEELDVTKYRMCARPQPFSGRTGCGLRDHKGVCPAWKEIRVGSWEVALGGNWTPKYFTLSSGMKMEFRHSSSSALSVRNWDNAIDLCTKHIETIRVGTGVREALLCRAVAYMEKRWNDMALRDINVALVTASDDNPDDKMFLAQARFIAGLLSLSGEYGFDWESRVISHPAETKDLITQAVRNGVRLLGKASASSEHKSSLWIAAGVLRSAAYCWAGATVQCLAASDRLITTLDPPRNPLRGDDPNSDAVILACVSEGLIHADIRVKDYDKACDSFTRAKRLIDQGSSERAQRLAHLEVDRLVQVATRLGSLTREKNKFQVPSTNGPPAKRPKSASAPASRKPSSKFTIKFK